MAPLIQLLLYNGNSINVKDNYKPKSEDTSLKKTIIEERNYQREKSKIIKLHILKQHIQKSYILENEIFKEKGLLHKISLNYENLTTQTE